MSPLDIKSWWERGKGLAFLSCYFVPRGVFRRISPNYLIILSYAMIIRTNTGINSIPFDILLFFFFVLPAFENPAVRSPRDVSGMSVVNVVNRSLLLLTTRVTDGDFVVVFQLYTL